MRAVAALALCAALGACRNTKLYPADVPIVGVTTTGGKELGVATDQGVLFLGRTAEKGPAKVLYHIDAAPVVEAGRVVPVGGSLFEVLLDVPVATVPISFEPLRPSESLIMMWLDGDEVRTHPVEVSSDPIVYGTAVRRPAGLVLAAEHVGAGVFRDTDAGLALVGLVKASARVTGGEEYLLLAGLPELRAAFLRPQPAVPKLEAIYRADGTRILRKGRR